MDAGNSSGAVLAKARTKVERKSERELIVTRTFNGPARIVFEAWTTPEFLKRWWCPKSTGMTLVSCETDVRVGGGYRFEFGHPAAEQPMVFFGKYTEVSPPSRLTWTNEESEGGALTTLTLEETGGKTLLTLREVYPSREALDAAIQSQAVAFIPDEGEAEGMESGSAEQFDQLDALLATLVARPT